MRRRDSAREDVPEKGFQGDFGRAPKGGQRPGRVLRVRLGTGLPQGTQLSELNAAIMPGTRLGFCWLQDCAAVAGQMMPTPLRVGLGAGSASWL